MATSDSGHVEWTEDYVQVMSDWLVGFGLHPHDRHWGCYDDVAAKNDDGSLAWPQELGWEIRECAVSSTKAAIRRAIEADE